jgi:hypothetical protein
MYISSVSIVVIIFGNYILPLLLKTLFALANRKTIHLLVDSSPPLKGRGVVRMGSH